MQRVLVGDMLWGMGGTRASVRRLVHHACVRRPSYSIHDTSSTHTSPALFRPVLDSVQAAKPSNAGFGSVREGTDGHVAKAAEESRCLPPPPPHDHYGLRAGKRLRV